MYLLLPYTVIINGLFKYDCCILIAVYNNVHLVIIIYQMNIRIEPYEVAIF